MRLLNTISLIFLVFLFVTAGYNNSTARENRIARNIIHQQASEPITEYDLFKEVNLLQPVPALQSAVPQAIYLEADEQALVAIYRERPALISFGLPLEGGDRQTVVLQRYEICSGDFAWYENEAGTRLKKTTALPFVTYRGYLAGDPQSIAAFTFGSDNVSAVLSTTSAGNFNLAHYNAGTGMPGYVLFRESDINGQRPPGCALADDMLDFFSVGGGQQSIAAKGGSNCTVLRVSMHADYQLYMRRSGDVNSVTGYVASVFNAAATLYANEEINFVLSELVINTVPDGYTFGSSTEVLFRFGSEIKDNFNGDIAHILTGARPNGWASLGGLAWLDVLCQRPGLRTDQEGNQVWFGPYGMSNPNVLGNVPEIPVYSWDVNAFTHETGHNIGSRHTQSCTWPGGPIDNCVAVEDGSCAPGPSPGGRGGTIMSYCHLSSIGVNFSLGFGPLPGNLIREKMSMATCLSSFSPSVVLDIPATERMANRKCGDGNWTYYYYDNNTADEEDDELLLIIGTEDANGPGDSIEVKVVTSDLYKTGAVAEVKAPYAEKGWSEINRWWRVTTAGAGATPLTVRFPFTQDDVDDIKGNFPDIRNASDLTLITFLNREAADDMTKAVTGSVKFYKNASSPDTSSWKLGREGKYLYAEYVSAEGIFGGSLGILPVQQVSVNKARPADETQMTLYPNPAVKYLFVQAPLQSGVYRHISVFDCLGNKVISRLVPETLTPFQLDISSLPSGVYFLRFIQGDRVHNSTFIRE